MILAESRHPVSLATKGIHHFLQWTRRRIPIGWEYFEWIAIKERKYRDLLTRLLKVRGDRIGHESAHGPAEEVVRPVRLNVANDTCVVSGHFLHSFWEYIRLAEVANLQRIERVVGWNMTDQPRIDPAESRGGMDAE